MIVFNQVLESYVEKIIGESKVMNYQTDPIPSKFMKMLQVYFTSVITTFIKLSLSRGTRTKDWKILTIIPLIKKANLSKELNPINQLITCA